MAEENQNKYESGTTEVETQDRGVFDFLGKKKEEEKPQEEVIVTEFEKVKVSEEPEKKKEEVDHEGEKKHSTLLEKLHRSDSRSSSVCLFSHFQFYFSIHARIIYNNMFNQLHNQF